MESRVNPIKAMQGLELGHVAAASTHIIGVEAAVLSLVETMNDAIKKESRSEAADVCMSAMLAFISDLYGTAKTQPISKEKQTPYFLAALNGMAGILDPTKKIKQPLFQPYLGFMLGWGFSRPNAKRFGVALACRVFLLLLKKYCILLLENMKGDSTT